jgi:hypothetical protein
MMQHWRVKLHYPRRIGNVEYFAIVARTRVEAIADVLRDEDIPRIKSERGQWLKVTARRDRNPYYGEDT